MVYDVINELLIQKGPIRFIKSTDFWLITLNY